ncbi:unnamed protein product [Cylindrotheca closterium]|uniref:Uncharacterized protein n=1 Tax=Cylindrotheca closterium TaxID=2856 RepID=A0AAD2FW03_9STRA|nr:unnamed protein product [Cylindrotheca closterium]
MHKRICKKLNDCASDYDAVCKNLEELQAAGDDSKEQLEAAIVEKMEASLCYVQLLIDHAYFSTDTIQRGAVIYENAMRMLLWCVDRSMKPFQNVQCLLVLAACLEYDEGVMAIIARLNDHHGSNEDAAKVVELVEIAMDPSFEHKGEGADLVYTCLLLIHVRRFTRHCDTHTNETTTTPNETRLKLEENLRTIMSICVEQCKWVLECVPPDGDPLLPEAANELFGKLSCWQLIKDSFALTPGLMDVFLDFCPLERSIR